MDSFVFSESFSSSSLTFDKAVIFSFSAFCRVSSRRALAALCVRVCVSVCICMCILESALEGGAALESVGSCGGAATLEAVASAVASAKAAVAGPPEAPAV